ncbi:MAG TPA: hypothetical protein VGK89_08820 [Candidatus Eisenbacteria bacterium]|jgi:hypothetical protein
MIHDPARRGRALAEFHRQVSPRLFRDLEESGALPAGPDGGVRERARAEWECFSLYACVRGLVAAGGFNRETGAAIESLHESALADAADPVAAAERRARVAERYAEYGAIGQEGGASGAATVTRRLGEAAARHMAAPADAGEALAELAGALHEQLVEGATEAVRAAE